MPGKEKERKTWIYGAAIVLFVVIIVVLSASMSSFTAGGGRSHYNHGIPVLGLIFETDCDGTLCSHRGVLLGVYGTVLGVAVLALAIWKITDLIQPKKKG